MGPSQVKTGGSRCSSCSMGCVLESETSRLLRAIKPTTEAIFVDLIIDKSVKMLSIPLETAQGCV